MKKSLIITTAAILAAGSIYLLADDDYEERYQERGFDKRYEMPYQDRYHNAAAYDGRYDTKRPAADRYENRPYDTPYGTPGTMDLTETEQAKLYKNECGSCHMAYQPGLLPKRSWQRVMTTLEDHFGTDATLDAADAQKIASYLNTHAANAMPTGKHMQKVATSVDPDAPMQISKTRYFVKEHRQIPLRYVKQPEVKSFANCNACHTKAESGSYREREIFIPNYGRWDD